VSEASGREAEAGREVRPGAAAAAYKKCDPAFTTKLTKDTKKSE